MRYLPAFLLSVISGLAFGQTQPPAAATCSPEKTAEILAPAQNGSTQALVNCSATLPAGSTVTKDLLFQGSQSSNIVFDCNGADIIRQNGSKDNVHIRSVQQNGNWQPVRNLVLRRCNIRGALRINGMDDDTLRTVSRQTGATAAIQAAAPGGITLDQINITGQGRIPLYLRPGVTRISIRNSRIDGQSDGTAVYFDMESADNVFENNTVNVQNKREQLAIDGSARNIIRHNRFLSPKNGGIFLYRNCGERGVIRHQTPSENLISSNYFANKKARFYRPIIWIASRNGGQSYCRDDAGYNFGSSADNRDFAENNQVIRNRFDKFWTWFTIRQNWLPNTVSDNRRS